MRKGENILKFMVYIILIYDKTQENKKKKINKVINNSITYYTKQYKINKIINIVKY